MQVCSVHGINVTHSLDIYAHRKEWFPVGSLPTVSHKRRCGESVPRPMSGAYIIMHVNAVFDFIGKSDQTQGPMYSGVVRSVPQ